MAEWLRQGPAKPRTRVRFPASPPGGFNRCTADPRALLAIDESTSVDEQLGNLAGGIILGRIYAEVVRVVAEVDGNRTRRSG